MKKRSTIASKVLLLAASLLFSCNDLIPDIKPVKHVEIAGVVSVDFPTGSLMTGPITNSKVAIKKVSDPIIEYAFDETDDIFRVATRSSYQVVLNIGKYPPQNDKIKATFILPDDLKNSLPNGYGFELFAQVYQAGGGETVDLFDIITTTYDATNGTLTALLPTWIFTDQRTSDQTYEAVFTLGTTPGQNVSSNSLLKDGDNNILTNKASVTDDECQAGQISCPIGSIDMCTSKKTSGFSRRKDPVTGKDATHWGVDYGINIGTTISAAYDGKIEKVRTQTDKSGNVIGYGLYVVVRHTDGAATLYGHFSSTNVQVGQTVKAGQEIGKSGNSGKSTGPHLHFEYVPNGQIIQSKDRIDPAPCISSGNANGSITVRDNGNLADDAFAVYLDDILIGSTQIGASNSIALSNLRPGDKTLKLVCTIAPDNVGTYEVILQSGITFKDSGGTIKSGTIPQGGSVSWTINVPVNPGVSPIKTLSVPNAYIEK